MSCRDESGLLAGCDGCPGKVVKYGTTGEGRCVAGLGGYNDVCLPRMDVVRKGGKEVNIPSRWNIEGRFAVLYTLINND